MDSQPKVCIHLVNGDEVWSELAMTKIAKRMEKGEFIPAAKSDGKIVFINPKAISWMYE